MWSRIDAALRTIAIVLLALDCSCRAITRYSHLMHDAEMAYGDMHSTRAFWGELDTRAPTQMSEQPSLFGLFVGLFTTDECLELTIGLLTVLM